MVLSGNVDVANSKEVVRLLNKAVNGLFIAAEAGAMLIVLSSFAGRKWQMLFENLAHDFLHDSANDTNPDEHAGYGTS